MLMRVTQDTGSSTEDHRMLKEAMGKPSHAATQPMLTLASRASLCSFERPSLSLAEGLPF